MSNDVTNTSKGISEYTIAQAVEVLTHGGMVAFPTETYYGLAVDPFNSDALARLFKAKKRKTNKPILTLIHDKSQLALLASDVPSLFVTLMEHFWPGPLTLIFDAHESLPVLLTADTDTVGIRISSHPVARLLVQAFGHPITATSANISGLKAAVNAQEIHRQFKTNIDMVLDCGQIADSAGSTIVSLKDNKLRLVRSGVIPFEEISNIVLSG